MEIYGGFAGVYDELMDNVPYEQWSRMLDTLIRKYGVSRPERGAEETLESERNQVLDLGCGTGTMAELMYGLGYDVMGVDLSEDMLNAAMEKREKSGSGILYLKQDMRELELYSTVGTIYSVCDSLNYILKEEELLHVFSLVNNYLFPGGIFVLISTRITSTGKSSGMPPSRRIGRTAVLSGKIIMMPKPVSTNMT